MGLKLGFEGGEGSLGVLVSCDERGDREVFFSLDGNLFEDEDRDLNLYLDVDFERLNEFKLVLVPLLDDIDIPDDY